MLKTIGIDVVAALAASAACVLPGDELAPFHCSMPPVLPTERNSTPWYGRGLLRRGISMWPMTGPGSKSVIAVMSAARPLLPHEQTFAGTHRTAVSCHNRL